MLDFPQIKTGQASINIAINRDQAEEECLQTPTQLMLKQYAGKWIGNKVLVAEDNAINYMLLSKNMELLGARVFRASNGVEAVELVRAIPDFSFVLMDVRMPRMDGVTAALIIKREFPDLPVVAQTAFVTSEDFTDNQKPIFDACLTKPILICTLVDMFRTFLPIMEPDAMIN